LMNFGKNIKKYSKMHLMEFLNKFLG